MNGIDIVGPQLSVLGAAGVIIVLDAFVPGKRKILPYVALLGVLISALWSVSWLTREDYQSAEMSTPRSAT